MANSKRQRRTTNRNREIKDHTHQERVPDRRYRSNHHQVSRTKNKTRNAIDRNSREIETIFKATICE